VELQKLRAEVRVAANIGDEISTLKHDIATLRSELSELKTLRNAVVNDSSDWPVLATPDAPVNHSTATVGPSSSYALQARQLAANPSALQLPPKQRKPAIIGKSVKPTNIKAVVTKRTIDVFTSRWNPHTEKSEVVDCVKDILQADNLDGINCVQLKSKYEHLYASFYVSVLVPSSDMKVIIDKLMSADSWPSGMLVRRYFHPKNG